MQSVRDNGVYTCSVDGRSEATVNVVISQRKYFPVGSSFMNL